MLRFNYVNFCTNLKLVLPITCKSRRTQELERLIVEGTLSPGQQLPPERELAKQFDVSRPSVREAILVAKVAVLSLAKTSGKAFPILC